MPKWLMHECGPHKGDMRMDKILRIKSCWDCPYVSVSGVFDVKETYHCDRMVGRVLGTEDTVGTIPGWCPLEDEQ